MGLYENIFLLCAVAPVWSSGFRSRIPLTGTHTCMYTLQGAFSLVLVWFLMLLLFHDHCKLFYYHTSLTLFSHYSFPPFFSNLPLFFPLTFLCPNFATPLVFNFFLHPSGWTQFPFFPASWCPSYFSCLQSTNGIGRVSSGLDMVRSGLSMGNPVDGASLGLINGPGG